MLFRSLAAQQGREIKPDSEPEKGRFYRSDHFEFAKVGVPSLYMKSGIQYLGKAPEYGRQRSDEYTNERYHKPSDEVRAEWDLSGAVQDIELLAATAEALANQPGWPAWKPGSEFRKLRPSKPKP